MSGIKSLKISYEGVELSSLVLDRPGLLIGRSPNCDAVIRRRNIAPVQFLVEWIGFDDFSVNEGEWALVDLGLDLSEGKAKESGIGLGQVLSEGTPYIWKGFSFLIAEDKLQSANIDSIVSKSITKETNLAASETSRVLELIFLQKSDGSLQDVAHLDFTKNKKTIVHPKIGGLEVLAVTDSDLQLGFSPAGREVLISKNNVSPENHKGTNFRYQLKNLDFVKIETKENEIFLRVTKRIEAPISRPSLFKDPLFKASVVALLLSSALMYGLMKVKYEEKIPEKVAPRIAKIEVKEVKQNKQVEPEKPAEVPQAKNEPPKQDTKPAAPPDPKTKKEVATKSTPLSEKKIAPKNEAGLNNQAKNQNVNAVGLLGALKPTKANKVKADMVVNNGVVSDSLSGKGGSVVMPQSPSGVMADTTKVVSGEIGGASTTLKVKDKGDGSRLGITAGGTGTGKSNGLGGDLNSADSVGLGGAGSEFVDGGLDRESIRRALAGYQREFRTCYERALLTKPNISGRVSYKWFISPDGGIGWVNVVKNETGSSQLELCGIEVIQKIKFAKAAKGTTVIYPFEFQAKGKGK